MIVTDRFVFVHMHKTGGQTINRVLSEHVPSARVIGYHYPLAELPAEAAGLPVVAVVRNPWDWYVSWYAFNRRAGIRNPLFDVASDDDTADFRTTVSNLIRLGADNADAAARRERLGALLPASIDGNKGSGLTKKSLDELAASGRGYLSWLFDRMIGGANGGRVEVCRFERLGGDFPSTLARLGVPEADAIRRELAAGKRANSSRHSHYSHYYDEELQTLVGEHERDLIDNYGYRFDSLKATGAAYAFPAADGSAAFRKLLGREKNFLRLNDRVDTDRLRARLDAIDDGRWAESNRQKIFNVHRDTEALQLVHFEDHKYAEPEYRPLYDELEDVVLPVIDYIGSYYANNGFVVRALLAKLRAGGRIPEHTDAGFSLLNCHRVHLPIITNDDVDFTVGGETIRMQAGELWEINNATMHGVVNGGADDRVHLIIDWMPNPENRPVAEVLAPDRPAGEEREAANAEMLSSIIGTALELQRKGQLDRAEGLYRQVLHFDPDHVVASNLLGLLCLRTRRFDEAARHIEHAIGIDPADAQAHGNLGLALKETGRLDDAARHLGESLRLAPDNPRVLSNLGGIYILTGRAEAAVGCFQRAVAIQPGMAEVHFNLGAALLHLDRYDEAAASFRQCVSLRPDFAEAQKRLKAAEDRSRASRAGR